MNQTARWPFLVYAALLVVTLGLIAGIAARRHVRHPLHRRLGRVSLSQPSFYVNPVINRNFPDPSILNDRGTFYAYATNSGANMPCARSHDLIHWTPLPDALPRLPSWAAPGRTWAPNVRAFVPGKRYVAYFCARNAASGAQAVGVATSSSPSGPFISTSAKPLIAQTSQGGAIDPSCFLDPDGSRYLVWKNDGNSRGLTAWLWIQKLSLSGTQLVGPRVRLIREDQGWEGNLVEAPTLWKHGSHYFLFYSANSYSTCSYAIGYAVSPSLLGPYTKPRSTPWVSSTSQVCGPGGEDIFDDNDGHTWMSYHCWQNGPGSYRSMSIDPLVWDGDVPYLLGPSRWSQPAPRDHVFAASITGAAKK